MYNNNVANSYTHTQTCILLTIEFNTTTDERSRNWMDVQDHHKSHN